jgi:ABC-2 type transport system permease protein
MRLFLIQLRWELYRAAMRPRTWLAFAAALIFEVGLSAAMRHPAVRLAIARDIWKMRWRFEESFSGLTTAAHMLGEVATVTGSFGIALFAGEIVAGEWDRGTLRTTLCRPISRLRLLLQKFIVCTLFVIVISVFNGASALAVGLLFERQGALIFIAPHEGVIGSFEFAPGLQRYVLSVGLLTFAAFSGMVVAFAFSCFAMRPATAAALAITILLADTNIRIAPTLRAVSPWCITTRLLSWRQVFNDEIPWPRIRRNYAELAWWDAGWLGIAWLGFRRRDLTR